MPSRQTRESEKQARCRKHNELTAQVPAGPSQSSFRCECGDRQCSRAITLTAAEYAVVRASAIHFAVAPNHENPESEQVIQENERYAIGKTVTGEATRLARRSDPRQERREKRWSRAGDPGKPS